MDAVMEEELKVLAAKYGADEVMKAIQQCFKDDEVIVAVKGFTGGYNGSTMQMRA